MSDLIGNCDFGQGEQILTIIQRKIASSPIRCGRIETDKPKVTNCLSDNQYIVRYQKVVFLADFIYQLIHAIDLEAGYLT